MTLDLELAHLNALERAIFLLDLALRAEASPQDKSELIEAAIKLIQSGRVTIPA